MSRDASQPTTRILGLPTRNFKVQASVSEEMKPTVQDEDMDDDLAAEEENKLINEVCFTDTRTQR